MKSKNKKLEQKDTYIYTYINICTYIYFGVHTLMLGNRKYKGIKFLARLD